MLIVPAEQKLDWSKPPILTLLLIIINCIIYWGYQGNDEQKIDHAVTYYINSGLYEKEKPLYYQYIDKEYELYNEIYRLDKAGYNRFVANQILISVGFDQFLKEKIKDDEDKEQWLQSRKVATDQRDEVSSIRFGIIPAKPTASGYFGSMFLHGSGDHLLGNMIFLFIFGFSLEIAIGRIIFTVLYLITGLAANALFVVLEPQSFIPGIGASGAIAGLMGMYLALYGLRKIKFFYWIGFYFNYFRAPAIAIFPIWLGKELYGAFFTFDHINYWAHIGGLISGFGLLYLTKNWLVKVDVDYIEKNDPNEPIIRAINQADNYISNFNLDAAQRVCLNAMNEYPENHQLLEKYYAITSHNPADKNFHQAALKIFQLAKNPQHVGFVHKIFKKYSQQNNASSLNSPKVLAFLTEHFSKHGYRTDAEILLKRLLKLDAKYTSLPTLLFLVAKACAKDKDQASYQRYLSYLVHHYPDSQQAKLLKKH
ncbi:rhomboid family intramembrane serine protease [Zooshikella sp. RANM57]|uniref:rhomboid family intramembrane serine protease n=1 Tax=Zooshikella sp. RANM57 TaxID=3425863 RepID=UPI003D6F7D45